MFHLESVVHSGSTCGGCEGDLPAARMCSRSLQEEQIPTAIQCGVPV